jgi:cell wall-associated NlpC family hydrolase
MGTGMARSGLRSLLCALLLALALYVPAGATGIGLGSWDVGDQHAVAQAGLLHVLDDDAFHGERPLTGTQLRDALTALAGRLGEPGQAAAAQAAVSPTATVSVAAFDRLLVDQLGLGDLAESVQQEAQRAGLAPPSRFGTEVVARQLGLRFNHPAPHDALELYPWQPTTRAEAAYSLARVLDFRGWEAQDARRVLGAFHLPDYTPAQRAALRIAVSKIGMPYVWGGETDGTSGVWGAQAHGGYDCSGFAWRVFKPGGLAAGRAIRGRTAAQMAGEIPRAARLHLDEIHPADLLFFGPGRFWQRATEARIVHVGIALSPDFMIHSSSEGVYVSPLFDDWRRAEFSWARRVL